MTTVAVLGGGVAGLTAAHELGDRGFDVTIYECRGETGGKARSEPAIGSGVGGRLPLPGEHGFRFFPGFYRHVPDTMKRIPFPGNAQGVFDNLVPAPRGLFAMKGRVPFQILMRLPQSLDDLRVGFELPDNLEAIGLTRDDFEFWMGKIVRMLLTSKARRYVEYDPVGWWDYIDAANRSSAFQLLLATGLTRNAVATQAGRANARTIADIAIQLLINMTTPGEIADRVLTGPTTDTWITPWVRHLEGDLGVHVRLGAAVEAIEFDGRRVTGVRIVENGARRTIEADEYVCALPLDRTAALVQLALAAADPSLQGLATLKDQMNWMTGIQFYLDYEAPLVRGHVNCLDSPWALTAVSQKQFWPNVDFSRYGDGTIRDVVSVDISDWTTCAADGAAKGKAAQGCTKDEIAQQAWLQLCQALNDPKPILTTYRSYWLDDAIVPAADGTGLINLDPLLVNEADSWKLRPSAALHIPNLVLAGDYVRTSTDFASMESACEAGRRAANAILARQGYSGSLGPCQVWDLHEPLEFAPARAADLERFVHGLPWAPPEELPLDLVSHIARDVEAVAETAVDVVKTAGFVVRRALDVFDPAADETERQVHAILERNAARPDPIPPGEWATFQVWQNLCFAHWPAPRELLRRMVPKELEIDEFEGQAFVSIVAMRMASITLREFGQVPGESHFPELNLRTYVKSGGLRGVYFFRADATPLLADLGARIAFNLPYTPAAMSASEDSDGTITFRSHRMAPPIPEAVYAARFTPRGSAAVPTEGSRFAFLRNRDYAFVVGADGRTRCLGLLHDPWEVEELDAEIQVNTILTTAGFELPDAPVAADFTRQISVVLWSGVELELKPAAN